MSKDPNSALENLPTEILIGTFKHMGWRDVLSSRQVCKRLFEISTARPLWMHLFYRLSAELMAPPILERPIDTYMDEEIEQIVLRRISSEMRWTSELPPTVRSIPLKFGESRVIALLLEGGRWLLLLQRGSGRVYAYDLDSSFCQEAQCIIDLGEASGTPEELWHMAADMDRDESHLTFNLCLIPNSMHLSASYAPASIHIYRVSLNGHGSGATLVAQKVKSLENRFRSVSMPIAFRGHYLVRSLQPHCSYVEVCNWFLSSPSTHWKTYIAVGSHVPQFITVLPNNKLMLLWFNTITFYNIANLAWASAGGSENDFNPTIQPYWTHSDGELHGDIYVSKPYRYLNVTRLAIAMRGVIYGLVIPHLTDDQPRYQLLAFSSSADDRRKPLSSRALGIDKVYVQRSNGCVETASYVWPDCEDQVETKNVSSLLVSVARCRKWDSPNKWSSIVLFDETSNRLFSTVGDGSYVVVDYACK